MKKSYRWLPFAVLLTSLGALTGFAAETKRGTVVTEHLLSARLRETRTGLDPNRAIMVYLPPGYAGSGKSYPVVYYFHSLFWSPAADRP